jgi:hypothetical protein
MKKMTAGFFFLPMLLCFSAFGQFHNYLTTRSLVDSLVKAYPLICKKETIGTSVEGREIYAVKISDNVGVDETEPELLFDSGIHGDEVSSEEFVISFMQDLCREYGVTSLITNCVNSREIWIIPYVNPDGRMNVTRANKNGVNLNRDFGYMWDKDGGSTRPFSQPETRAYTQWWLSRNFTFTWSYHDPFEQMAWSWGYRPQKGPENPLLDTLARECAALSGGYYRNNGPTYTVMYQITGGSMDYQEGSRGVPAWMVEAYKTKFPTDYTLLPPVYAKNKAMMLHVAQKADQGIGGRVTDRSTGTAVAASLLITGQQATLFPFYNSPSLGDYCRMLLPGSYSVSVRANGYRDTVITGVNVSRDALTVLNVNLDPVTTNTVYAQSVVLAVVPGVFVGSTTDPARFRLKSDFLTPNALGKGDKKYYSLGKGGYIAVDMGRTIKNVAGNDIRVVEDDARAEGYTVKVTGDWLQPVADWKTVGQGIGSKSFDISSAAIDSFRYVLILDDRDDADSLAADAGFDLDAIEAYPSETTQLVSGPASAKNDLNLMLSFGRANGQARISFNLPVSGIVRLSVHSADGRLIKTLAEGRVFTAGRHAVDLMAGTISASGLYVVRLEFGERVCYGTACLVD